MLEIHGGRDAELPCARSGGRAGQSRGLLTGAPFIPPCSHAPLPLFIPPHGSLFCGGSDLTYTRLPRILQAELVGAARQLHQREYDRDVLRRGRAPLELVVRGRRGGGHAALAALEGGYACVVKFFSFFRTPVSSLFRSLRFRVSFMLPSERINLSPPIPTCLPCALFQRIARTHVSAVFDSILSPLAFTPFFPFLDLSFLPCLPQLTNASSSRHRLSLGLHFARLL